MKKETTGIFRKARIRLAIIALLAFSIWVAWTLLGQWADIRETQKQIEAMRAQEERILSEKSRLEREKILLHNYDYIAEIAREYYFLSKPDEIIIISPDE